MKNIALLIKADKPEGISCAQRTIEILSEYGCNLYIDTVYKNMFAGRENIYYVDYSNIFDNAECVIVFGGDGTIMRAAHSTDLPILAINLGRIGYIAELETDELDLLKELVNDNFTLEYRMMLRCNVTRDGKLVYETFDVLNEIGLSKDSYSSMPEIEFLCNGEEVGKYIADGLICATPTGSTAYSLAAGGSIVDTRMNCFCVTPVAPQSFYAKPLIFGGREVLQFKKGKRGHGKLLLVVDGDFIMELIENDVVTVSRSKRETKLIKIKKNNFYSVMRSKMTEI